MTHKSQMLVDFPKKCAVYYKEENGNFLAFHVIKYWITILLLMLLSKENHKGQKWTNTLNDQPRRVRLVFYGSHFRR